MQTTIRGNTSESSRIIVTPPAAGQISALTYASGDSLEFSFDPNSATFTRDGGNLLLTFEGGGQIVVPGFFEGEKLASITLADGTTLDGGEFLKNMNPDIEIETAAGPASGQSATSGGSGEYADDAGALVDGIGRLGSLGTDYWSGSSENPEIFVANNTVAAGASSPGQTSGPESGTASADERFVMYMKEPVNGLKMEGLAQAKQHLAATLGDETPIFGVASIDGNGNLVYTLSEEGAQALKDALAGGIGPVFDYMSYIDEYGVEHTVQVVLTTGTEHVSSEVVDPARNDFSPAMETHMSEHPGGVYTVVSTDGADVLTFVKDVMGGGENTTSTMDTGKGDDSVNMEGYFGAWGKASSKLSTGDGNDTVTIASVYSVGDTEIDMGGNDNLLHVKGGVTAQGGTVSVLSGDGKDTVNIDGSSWAYNGGKVTIDTGENADPAEHDVVNVAGGLYTSGVNSHTAITSDVVKLGSYTHTGGAQGNNQTFGMFTETKDSGAEASATITARQSVHIGAEKIDTDPGYVTDVKAVFTGAGGQANVTAEVTAGTGIEVTAKSGVNNALGIDSGEGAKLTMETAEGVISVNATSGAGFAEGLRATSHGSTTLTGPKVEVNATSTGGGLASGMYATNHGENIVLGTAADINATGNGDADVTGMRADKWEHYGHYQGGENRVDVDEAAVVRATGTGQGAVRGLFADYGGSNAVSGKTVDIITTGQRDVRGVHLEHADSTNTIRAEENVLIQTTSGMHVKGLHAARGENIVESATGDVIVKSVHTGDSGDVHGLLANVSGTNRITAENGEVNISAVGGPQGRGLDASAGTNIVKGAEVHISSENTRDAVAAAVTGGGKNEIHSGSDITMNAQINGASYGDWAAALWTNSDNTTERSANILEAQDTVTLNAGHAERTVGIRNENGLNQVTAATVNINALDGSGMTSGLIAGGSRTHQAKAETIITADTVDIKAVASATGSAEGMFANNDGTNSIKGSGKASLMDVDVLAQATSGNAYGMYAYHGGGNHIEGAESQDMDVKITAHTKGGTAYGMIADTADGANSITGSGENMRVEIKAEYEGASPSDEGHAYGLFAKGGVNTIDGSGSGSGMTVSIIASSTRGESVAMFAHGERTDEAAMNLIKGTDYGDHISIEGEIRTSLTGANKIETGAGNDTIELNGAINAYSPVYADQLALNVNAGDGYDTLVLHADTPAIFKANYESWLNTLFSGDGGKFADTSIEALSVDLKGDFGMNDIAWLINSLSKYNKAHSEQPIDFSLMVNGELQTDLDLSVLGVSDDYLSLNVDLLGASALTLNGGDGDDTLQLNGSGDALSSILEASSINGFEELVLDMRNEGNDTLNIDVLLGNMGDAKNVFVKGDAADAVTGDAIKAGNYVETGSDNVNGTNYTWYSYESNSNSDEMIKVYIQEGLI